LRAAEQKREDVARARRTWIREQGLLDSTKLVFIDETSVNTNMVRLYGRCPCGERLVDHVPFGHWETMTFVSSLRHDGMVAPSPRVWAAIVKAYPQLKCGTRLGRFDLRASAHSGGAGTRRRDIRPTVHVDARPSAL
jgi:hypothetical protein